MSGVYQRFGVRTIINASGPATRLSGSIMAPEVAEAMAEAGRSCVDIAELQAAASNVIARHTGAEAGYVTSGAAAGLLLGTAACVTGLDPTRMNRLPDTTGMKRRVVMARSHRNFYDHAVRSVGIELVEIGIADRYSGAGVRDAEPWEYAAAIDDDTAAVVYVAYAHTQPELSAVVEVAHAASVPVIVDAAGQLPPASNLQRFLSEGADLVAFSGGKAIAGPQSSGILAGRPGADPGRRPAAPRPRHPLGPVEPPGRADRQEPPARRAAPRHREALQGRQGGDRRPADGPGALRGRGRRSEAGLAGWST